MNYFRNLEEYMAYMSGKAEKLVPVEVKEDPVKAETEPEEKPKPKRSRKKKGDE